MDYQSDDVFVLAHQTARAETAGAEGGMGREGVAAPTTGRAERRSEAVDHRCAALARVESGEEAELDCPLGSIAFVRGRVPSETARKA